MAIDNAKIFNVRIKNKYDSYENWAASSIILEAGEIAIAQTTVDVKVDNGTVKHPALLMKVGDGEKTFANLPWLSAKAADVLSVCKNETDLTEFVNNIIANAGIASDDAVKTLTSRVTTAEGAIDVLETLVGEDTVKNQIDAAITALNLEGTYEKVGVAAELVSPVSEKANANESAIEVINDETNGILAKAKAHTDNEVAADRERLNALEAKFTGNDSVADQIAAAVAVEKERAEGAESDLAARIKIVEDDYLKAADKEELQGNIDVVNDKVATLIGNDTNKSVRTIANEELAKQLIAEGAAESLDTLQEIAQWIQDHPGDASAMNQAIANLEALVGELPEGITATTVVGMIQELVAAEQSRAQGVEAGHETRIKALEDANAEGGAVANAIAEAKQAGIDAATAVETLKNTEVKANTEAITKEVSDREVAITTVKQEAAADATTKADKALADAKTHVAEEIAKLDSSVTVSSDKHVLTSVTEVDGKLTDKTEVELADVAFTGSTDDLVQGTMTLVFNCGTSAV